MEKNITMRDIATSLGVSTVTVSNALSNREGVSNELRSMIKKKAEEMGYQYNLQARALRESKSYNIGVLVADHYLDKNGYPFYLKMYQSIVMCLSGYNYSGIMEVLTAQMRNDNILPSVIVDKKVDGIIVLGQLASSYLNMLKESQIPMVFLDFYDRKLEIVSIISDSVYGTYMLTNYVISKGHRKIAFVGNIYATASILDRYLGYYRSLLMNGIPLREDYIICDRGDDGLNIDLVLPEDMPTAFVCNCDVIAFILMNKLKKAGYRVPEDISVVGFDNYSYAPYSTDILTTIDVNIEGMTNAAIDELNKIISGESQQTGGRKIIGGNLIIRSSVADLNIQDETNAFHLS